MTWVVLGHGFLYPQQVSGESVSHMCLALPPAARGDLASSSVSHPLMDTAFSSVSHPLVDMASSSVSYPLVDMASSSVTACWVSDICGRSLLFN